MELGECSTSTPPRANKRQRNTPFEEVTPNPSFTSPSVMKKMPCDVFINHRGCDTKLTLASSIYHSLDMNNINAFLDVEELELGDSIPVEIQEAMDAAVLHIAIFSEKYAESAWCLAELSYMFQTGTTVIPVFYHVDPNDLRWVDQGKGCYALAFSQHEEKGRYSSNKLHDWKTALQRASNLSGHVLNKNIGAEGMLLKSIVNSTFRLLRKEPLEVAKHPVGMDEIVRDFERSREEYVKNEAGVEIVGIVGLGGSGKTTLATELYNRKRSSINRSSFLHDVRDAASKNVLHTKQKKLLDDLGITSGSFDNVDNVKEGKAIIANQLRSVCVLIVLDDVDHEEQLDALLPPKESLERGSIVIITTRDESILRKWGITSIYKIRPLQRLHAKQLFSWHAFLDPSPPQAFEDLVEKFLDYCHGLPLSLKVIGGQICGAKTICREYLVSLLKKIEKILDSYDKYQTGFSDILKMLRVSYDALDEEEQEIFLDVACFFIGERKSVAIEVWDASGWSGLISLETLQNKCLVEIYEGKWNREERMRMHDHLRDLGRQIAKTHARPRIRIKGFPFRGITTSGDRRIKFERGWGEAIECIEKCAIEKCAELQRGVLWLECDTSIPSWLLLDTIVILKLDNAEYLETLWEDSRPPLQLRELTASNLQSLPRSIGRLQHLKRIVIEDSNLLSLPDCFGDLVNLQYLSLPESRTLERLPEIFCKLKSLEHLDLVECDALSSLPDCFGDLVNLQYLSLRRCITLERLPEEFCKLKSLEHLDLAYCSALSSLPNRFGDLMKLKHLDLYGCDSLKRLPDSFKKLKQIKYLDVDCCESLESLDNIPNVKAVYFRDRDEELKDTSVKSGQFFLHFCQECISLLPIVCQLSGLKELEIDLYYWSGNLPNSFGNLSSLTSLKLTESDGWKYLPIEISQMSSLRNLTIGGCESLYKISNLEGLVSLTNLKVKYCPTLQKIEGLEHLTSLTNLEVKDCEDLQKIEGLEHLTSLENLVLWGCKKLRWCNEGRTWCTEWCKKAFINVLRSLSRLERLQTLNLRSKSISDFGDCIQNIEMEKWPREMTISATHLSHKIKSLVTPDLETEFSFFEPILDPFRCRDVHVHPITEWSSIQRNLSNAAVLCYLTEREELIVITLFKEDSCTLPSLDVADVFGGCLIIGERGCILDGFKQLFQTISLEPSDESRTSSDESSDESRTSSDESRTSSDESSDESRTSSDESSDELDVEQL